jgi:hypothetical protein
MNGHRRLTGSSGAITVVGVTAVLGAMGLAAPLQATAAAPRHSAAPIIGHLAYLTNGGAIDTVDVHGNGVTGGRHQIGPVETPTTAHPVTISSFVASGDGKWLAWQEARTTSSSRFTTLLVDRNQVTGTVHTVKTGRFPVGFASDRLLTFGRHVARLVLSPSPHFVRVAGGFPLTAYAHGVVDDRVNSNDTAATLRLTSMSGHHTVLHHYTDVGPPDYRETSQAWVSGDGERLVVERGDHQDFGGLGPSSLADEFALHGSHARTQLGHYGALHGEWRLGDVAFRGPSDTVWAAWHAVGRHGVKTAAAEFTGGHWVTLRKKVIDVAGNIHGDLVVQPGSYHLQNPNDNFYARHASSQALLLRHGATHGLGIKGTQFYWVSG